MDPTIPHEKLTGALRRQSVKKNVAAIHVSGKLTLLQRKLSNVLLLNAYDTGCFTSISISSFYSYIVFYSYI